jgi:hypothetical protein
MRVVCAVLDRDPYPLACCPLMIHIDIILFCGAIVVCDPLKVPNPTIPCARHHCLILWVRSMCCRMTSTRFLHGVCDLEGEQSGKNASMHTECA